MRWRWPPTSPAGGVAWSTRAGAARPTWPNIVLHRAVGGMLRAPVIRAATAWLICCEQK